MRRLALSTLLALLLALSLPSFLSAQDRPPPPPPPPPGQPDPQPPPPPHQPGPEDQSSPERRKELRRRIQAHRMARLTQVLDLDDATAAKLFPLLNRHDEKIAALSEEHGATFAKIDAALHSGGKDSELAPLLDRVAEIEKAVHEDDETTTKKIRDALTPSQMAKFLVFNAHFHDEVRAILEDARHETKGGDPESYEAIAARVSVIVDEVSKHMHEGHPDPGFLAPRFAQFDRLVERFKTIAPAEVQRDVLPHWMQWAEAVGDVRKSVGLHVALTEGNEILRTMQQALHDGHPEAVDPLFERLSQISDGLKRSDREDVRQQAEAFLAHGKEAVDQAHAAGGGVRKKARAFLESAQAAAKAGDFEGALSDTAKAIELDPHDAAAFGQRGAVLEAMGKKNEAAQDYEHALELSPHGPEAKGWKTALERCRGK